MQRTCVQSEEPHYGYVDVHLHYLEGHSDWVPVALHDPANVFSVVFEAAMIGITLDDDADESDDDESDDDADDQQAGRGAYVKTVSGPAEECGKIEVGDYIIDVNGESTTEETSTKMRAKRAVVSDIVHGTS